MPNGPHTPTVGSATRPRADRGRRRSPRRSRPSPGRSCPANASVRRCAPRPSRSRLEQNDLDVVAPGRIRLPRDVGDDVVHVATAGVRAERIDRPMDVERPPFDDPVDRDVGRGGFVEDRSDIVGRTGRRTSAAGARSAPAANRPGSSTTDHPMFDMRSRSSSAPGEVLGGTPFGALRGQFLDLSRRIGHAQRLRTRLGACGVRRSRPWWRCAAAPPSVAASSGRSTGVRPSSRGRPIPSGPAARRRTSR